MPHSMTVDSQTQLRSAGLAASSAAAQVSGVAKVLDVGLNCRVKGEIIIDVSAIEIASNDEAYTIVLQGSPDAAFTAAGVVELCALHLGAKETKLTDADKDDDVGRYILRFINEHKSTLYRYLRLYTVVAGSIATGINYAAYAVVDGSAGG